MDYPHRALAPLKRGSEGISFKSSTLTGGQDTKFPLPRLNPRKSETSKRMANSISQISLPPTGRDPPESDSRTCVTVSWVWSQWRATSEVFSRSLPRAGSLCEVTLSFFDPLPHSLNRHCSLSRRRFKQRISRRCTISDRPQQQD